MTSGALTSFLSTLTGSGEGGGGGGGGNDPGIDFPMDRLCRNLGLFVRILFIAILLGARLENSDMCHEPLAPITLEIQTTTMRTTTPTKTIPPTLTSSASALSKWRNETGEELRRDAIAVINAYCRAKGVYYRLNDDAANITISAAATDNVINELAPDANGAGKSNSSSSSSFSPASPTPSFHWAPLFPYLFALEAALSYLPFLLYAGAARGILAPILREAADISMVTAGTFEDALSSLKITTSEGSKKKGELLLEAMQIG